MDWIREYLLRIICAAILCGAVTGLLGKKGALGAAIKLIAGVFMVLTLVTPWIHFDLSGVNDLLDEVSASADGIVQSGQNDAADALADIIKSESEAYILDKAKYYGAELTVEVKVEGSGLPVPCAVWIKGSISPYGRAQLENMIAEELGIGLEDQTWTG